MNQHHERGERERERERERENKIVLKRKIIKQDVNKM